MGGLVGAALVLSGLLRWPLAAGVGGAIAILIAVWLLRRAPRLVLKAMGAQPLIPGSQARLENILDGLCTTHGMTMPKLHVVEDKSVNAAWAGMGRKSAHLVFTRGALGAFDRLELEAVVARGLCEIRRGLDAATVLASAARFPGARRVIARLSVRILNCRSVISADIEAVRLTSYPPALVTALRKAAAWPRVAVCSTVAHLWFAATAAETAVAPNRPPTSQRIEALGEL